VRSRDAACHCGQLRLEVAGDPFSVSICSCFACQRRTGSAFGIQAGFKADQVKVHGSFNDFTRISDESDHKAHVFHFCPTCGSQVFYTEPTAPDLIVVAVGSFADPTFPPPTDSGYDSRRPAWVQLPDSIRTFAPMQCVIHGDPGPFNTIFEDGMPVAFIDWDGARPGAWMSDLAYLAWTWCIQSSGNVPVVDQARHLRALRDGYGRGEAQALVESIIRSHRSSTARRCSLRDRPRASTTTCISSKRLGGRRVIES
jgi:hypothetical protein